MPKKPMKNITINFPDKQDELIQKLISMGLIKSRSEAVRTAIKNKIDRDKEFLKKQEIYLK